MKILILFLILTTSNQILAQQFTSGKDKVQLVELYTSEGCSSCPPADRWLSSLKQNSGLWNQFVPIALHVDYWDYIGWSDPYASREYSQRQRLYAKEFSETTVYTPGVRKAGFEWRSWRMSGNPIEPNPAQVGELSLEVDSDGGFSATYNDESGQAKRNLQLNLAILGLDLVSEVSRGENRGKQLKHDFVVLGITKLASGKATSTAPRDSRDNWSGQLPTAKVSAPAYAVAAWVTNGNSLLPIQTIGGLLAPALKVSVR